MNGETGVIIGGWEYVAMAYAITWSVLIGYGIVLTVLNLLAGRSE